MIKVLQISKYYYPFLGGIEQVARDMVYAMSKIPNVEQKMICFNEDATDNKIICHKNEDSYERVDGIEIVRCGYQAKISSQAISLSYKRELNKLMNEFKPDIVILHYPNPFVTRYLLKHKSKDFKLWVYWHLDITKQKFLKIFFNRQNIELINRADRILGATPKHLEESEYTSYFKEKKTILPYTIDEKNLQINDDEIKLANTIKRKYSGQSIGFFIGRHVPYKGLQYLIDASKQIKNQKVHFIIAGNGELTEELKNRAKDDSKIEFIGRISDSERRAYLYACDFICFPSITRNEAFGLALAEGMYYGKPAITFTIPGSGVNYVNLDKVTGIECANKNVTEYAASIVKLINNEDLRTKYGNAARKRILENFTEDVFKNNLEKLILGDVNNG